MGISLASLLEDQRVIPVTFSNGSLSVTYRPSVITPEWASRAENDPIGGITVFLADTVVCWDAQGPIVDHQGVVLVESGEAIPVDREFIKFVPSIIGQRIVDAINKDVRSQVTTGSGGSDPKKA